MSGASWDEASDLRRFWWVLPPLVFAAVTFGMLRIGSLFGEDRLTDRAETVSQRLSVGDAPRIEVRNLAGDIAVRIGPPGAVRVQVERRSQGFGDDDAFDNLGQFELRIEATDDGVLVQTSVPTGVSADLMWAEILLIVPPDSVLELRTGRGSIDAHATEGDITAVTGQGDIELAVPGDRAFRVAVRAPVFTTDFDGQHDPDGPRDALTSRVGDNPRQVFTLTTPQGHVVMRET